MRIINDMRRKALRFSDLRFLSLALIFFSVIPAFTLTFTHKS
jgi:hypothetical protein